ncbi:hypothetical protein ACI2KR_08035 [Pseudomonas luteola]
MLSVIPHLSQLAGLWHDMGKACAGFQLKLRNDHDRPDALRHELLSVLIFQYWIKSTFKKPVHQIVDHEWLQIASNPKQLAKSLSTVFKARKLLDPRELKGILAQPNAGHIEGLTHPANTTSDQFVHQVILRSLQYLIISHHQEPVGSYANKSVAYPTRYEHYVNPEGKPTTSLWSNLPEGSLHVWEVSYEWVQLVSESAGALLHALTALSQKLKSDKNFGTGLLIALTHIARTSLIQADFVVSSQKAEEPNTDWVNSAAGWANTKLGKAPGQRLDDHLVRVGRMAGAYAELMSCKQTKRLTRPLDAIRQTTLSPKYKWQLEAEQLMSGINAKEGLLMFLLAGTGSGKTLGAVRIMSAASPEGLRFNAALGLRTLTLQTVDSYQKDLGLSRNEAALVIGSDVEKSIFYSEQADEHLGTGHGLDKSLEDVVIERRAHSNLPDKIGIMTATPIVVSTIDTIIDCVVSPRNNGILSTLRVCNADLILDEVDSYSETDLISIAKLVELAGFFNRKIIISSATTTPEIAELMYISYKNGQDAGRSFFDRSTGFNCAWASEHSATNRIARVENRYDFVETHISVVENIAHELQKVPAKRKAALLRLPSFGGINGAYKRICDASYYLHNRNHEIDPITGKRISFGLMRFSNIRECVEFSNYMIHSDSRANFVIRVCAYHSQQMVGFQHLYEKFYNRLLNRKPIDGHPAICSHSEIRDLLDDTDATNVMIIMVSSPIEEVGRDHDFDWVIVEPTSVRAVIQTVGRCLRHRDKIQKCPNVMFLSRPIRAIRYMGQPAFSYPGPETYKELFRTFTPETSEMLNMDMMEKGIDSSSCILPERMVTSELARRERAVQRHFFFMSDNSNLNAESRLDQTVLRLNQSHNKHFPFRGDSSTLGFSRGYNTNWSLLVNDKVKEGTYDSLITEMDVEHERWLYQPSSQEVDLEYRGVFRNLSQKDFDLKINTFSIQDHKKDGTVPQVAFSVQTGGYKVG